MKRISRTITQVFSLSNDSTDSETTGKLAPRVEQDAENIINRILGTIKFEEPEKIA